MTQTFEDIIIYVKLKKGEVTTHTDFGGIPHIYFEGNKCYDHGFDNNFVIGKTNSLEEAKYIVHDFLSYFDVGIDRFRLVCESVIKL